MILSDLEGTLEPCGCAQRPAGGLDRVAAALARLRSGPPPTLTIATGNVFASPDAQPSQTARRMQDLWKAETFEQILARLELDLFAPSTLDFNEAPEALSQLTSSRARTILLGRSNLSDHESSQIGSLLSVGGLRVGVVAGRWDLASAADQLAKHASQLRRRGAQLVLALLYGAAPASRDAAADIGAEIIVVSSEATTPSIIQKDSSTWLLGGRHGEGMWLIDLYSPEPDRGEGFTVIERSAGPDDTRALAHVHYEALGETAPRDPEVRSLLDRLFERMATHARAQAPAPQPPSPDQPSYVGSQTCAACHTKAYFWWRSTPHGRAYETLIARGREYDLECVGCHTTGFEEPGGASLAGLKLLRGVGCESCHGPGSLHVEQPHRRSRSVQRNVPEAVCRSCHDPEHSDDFDYVKQRKRVLSGSHGADVP